MVLLKNLETKRGLYNRIVHTDGDRNMATFRQTNLKSHSWLPHGAMPSIIVEPAAMLTAMTSHQKHRQLQIPSIVDQSTKLSNFNATKISFHPYRVVKAEIMLAVITVEIP